MKQVLRKIGIVIFSFFILGQILTMADFVLAGYYPIFNNDSQDLPTLRLKNRTQGDNVWQKSISAKPGDRIAFDVYYHNTVFGTVANNAKVKIVFPTSKQNSINPLAYVFADNADRVSGNASIIIAGSPEKLVFNDIALWYPRQGTVGQSVSISRSCNSVEVNIGNIKGCWPDQGHVVFEAVLSKTPSNPNLSISEFVRNISTGQTHWRNSVQASPSDKIGFKIKITSTGDAIAKDVFVKDNLPSKMNYNGNLYIDGVYSSASAVSGINIGDLSPGQTKTITFESLIKPETNFSYGATNLVNYARIYADGVFPKRDSASIKVLKVVPSPAHPDFSVKKLARNISKRQIYWHDSVQASPLDKIGFKIEIISTGDSTVKNLLLKDILPGKMFYLGNLKIDGVYSSASAVSGINIGDLSPGQTRFVTFDSRVYGKTSFNYGKTKLINKASVYNRSLSKSDIATVIVNKTAVAGAATEVNTGFSDRMSNKLFLPLLIALVLVFLFRNQFFRLDEWLEKQKKEREEYQGKKELDRKIKYIKKKETLV